MLPIKINADYEFQLFNGKQGKQAINYSLEFLAFYIEEGPFFSTKNMKKWGQLWYKRDQFIKYYFDILEQLQRKAKR
jgi:hypothetical protein